MEQYGFEVGDLAIWKPMYDRWRLSHQFGKEVRIKLVDGSYALVVDENDSSAWVWLHRLEPVRGPW